MKFGDVTVERVKGSSELRRLLPDDILGSDVVIVKPNWFSPHPGNFTSAEALRTLLEALNSRIVVVESYTLEKHDGSMSLMVDGEAVDWRWVMGNPRWDWAEGTGAWDEIRRQDSWFLETYGFTDLFEELDVDYLNVTEEVWSMRTAPPKEVKTETERRYSPASSDDLYGFLPTRLHELRGSPLISYGRVKGVGGSYPSLTLKNLFGLIPDPLRSWWHGPEDKRLGSSIVDIAKVYHTYFRVYGVCEALTDAVVNDPRGEVKVPWGRYRLQATSGFVSLGPNLVSLDAVLCGLIGVDPETVNYLKLGGDEFGAYEREIVAEAQSMASLWFPPNP